ncbi:MAG: C25 family cysteine peptidase [bacterium]|nr:C25 family cysteine peptidase [bacterium]
MKTLSLLLALLVLFGFSSAGEATIEINVVEEINKNNFYYNSTEMGEIIIEKRVVIERSATITSVTAVFGKDPDLLLPPANPKPEYSTSGADSFYRKTQESHISYTAGRLTDRTYVIISFSPVSGSDTVAYAKVTINYKELESETKKSIFDFDARNAASWNAKGLSDTATLDMVIITSSHYVPLLESFCEHENLMGIKTIITETESIYSLFPGADEQEKIRNYIKSQYAEKGIRFVLIAGGTEIVPVRLSFSSIYYHIGYIPTDLYYADMNGNWNMDKDDEIGELMSDIEDGFPDIAVSRIPFSNEEELENILSKYFRYVFSNNASKTFSFLHMGASLLSGLTDGSGQLMSEMIIAMNASSQLVNRKLYAPVCDTFNDEPAYSGDVQLNRQSFIIEISEGYHYINHIDHSGEFFLGTGNLDTKTEYSSWDTLYLSNADSVYSIMFTMGCSANGYDRNSASNGLLKSMKSSVSNIVGFTRTGWTGSQGLMNRYWKMILDSSSSFTGDALRFALIDNSIYFRVAVNMIGFSTMPVYTRPPEKLHVEYFDTFSIYDTVRISVLSGDSPVRGAKIVLMDDSSYLRFFTDADGRICVLPGMLSGNVRIGVSLKNHIPYDGSFFVGGERQFNVSSPVLIEDRLIGFLIENRSSEPLLLEHVHAGGDDSLFFFNKDIFDLTVSPNGSVQIICTLYYYKNPLIKTVKKIGFEVGFGSFTRSDSLSITLEPEKFSVASVFFAGNDNPFIDSILLEKSSDDTLFGVFVKISSLTQGITVSDSLHEITSWNGRFCSLRSIKMKRGGSDSTIERSTYKIIFSYKMREETLIVRGMPADTEITILSSVKLNHTAVYFRQSEYRTEIYRLNSISGEYYIAASLEPGEILFKDFNAPLGTSYYYAVFKDNLDRIVDTSNTVAAVTYSKSYKSTVKTSGSFYGSLDGKRYYARSSMNASDLDKDGAKNIVLVADDGKFFILDENLNDITPFTLFTTPHNETTPAIGDIDMNGYPDIVIGNGSALSETTAFIILNPMDASRRIIPICSLGVLTASPVIANIDADNYNEVLLGTSKVLAAVNHDRSSVWQAKSIINVWGIAVSEVDSKFFANDYYGNIYSYDFAGIERSGFPYRIGLVTVTPMILTDIDSDDCLDIVLGTASGKLYVVNEYGALRDGFPHTCAAGIYHTPRIFDIGKDRNQEMIFSDINGNICVVDNSGARMSTAATNEQMNTYNELLIYDFNGDKAEDFVFVTRGGKIAVYNQQLSPIFPQFVQLEDMVMSCPIAVDFYGNMKPSLVVRDYAGNLFRIESYSSSSFGNGISFSKTLFDERNTSFVAGVLLRSQEKSIPECRMNIKSAAVLKEHLVKDAITILYSTKEDYVEATLINKLGEVVANKKLSPALERHTFDVSDLACGEYFVRVTGGKKELLKEKIVVLR